MRLCPGLGPAGLIGLAVAAVGVTSPGRAALRELISAWAGFAVLRDRQQYVGALGVVEASGLGAGRPPPRGAVPARLAARAAADRLRSATGNGPAAAVGAVPALPVERRRGGVRPVVAAAGPRRD